jgi:hypothetical protein
MPTRASTHFTFLLAFTIIIKLYHRDIANRGQLQYGRLSSRRHFVTAQPQPNRSRDAQVDPDRRNALRKKCFDVFTVVL